MDKQHTNQIEGNMQDFTTVLLVLAASFAGAAEISAMARIGSAVTLYLLFFIIRKYGTVRSFAAGFAEKTGFGADGLIYKTIMAIMYIYIFIVILEKVLTGLSVLQLMPKTGSAAAYTAVFYKSFAAIYAAVPVLLLLAGFVSDNLIKAKDSPSRPAVRSISMTGSFLLILLPLLLLGAGMAAARDIIYYAYPLFLLAIFVIITGCSRRVFTLPVLSVYIPVLILAAVVSFIKYFHNIHFPAQVFYAIIVLAGSAGLVFLLKLRLRTAAKAWLTAVFLPLIFLSLLAMTYMATFE